MAFPSELAAFHLIVARCQSDSGDADTEVVGEAGDDNNEVGIVGEDAQDYATTDLGPAHGVDTVCVFPKNSARCEFTAELDLFNVFENAAFLFLILFPFLQWFQLEKRLNYLLG